MSAERRRRGQLTAGEQMARSDRLREDARARKSLRMFVCGMKKDRERRKSEDRVDSSARGREATRKLRLRARGRGAIYLGPASTATGT